MSRPPQRPLLLAGVAGPALFCAVFSIEGALRPGYDALSQQVSLLSLGSRGWVQVANFAVFGLLVIAFAIGARSALAPGRGAVAVPALLGIFGLTLLLAAAFATDPQPPNVQPIVFNSHGLRAGPTAPVTTLHGLVHAAAAVAGFAALAAACLAFARRAWGEGGRAFALYSIASGVLALVLLLASAGAGSWAGLVQRSAIAAGWLWILLLAVRLLRRGRDGERPPSRASNQAPIT